jgi:hypothetical protein
MMEAKIEEVIKSPVPLDCFTNKTVEPQKAVFELWATMAQAGDLQALREASKLLKIDEKRFDRMVYNTMAAAISRGNPFTLLYQGFDLGDPAIDKRLVAFAEGLLKEELPKLGNPIFDTPSSPRRQWAEVLVDRYGAAPTESQWSTDALASRLRPEISKQLHNDLIRFATDAAQRRARK